MDMDDEAIRAAIERARRLTEPEPEPYRSLAFRAPTPFSLQTEAASGRWNQSEPPGTSRVRTPDGAGPGTRSSPR